MLTLFIQLRIVDKYGVLIEAMFLFILKCYFVQGASSLRTHSPVGGMCIVVYNRCYVAGKDYSSGKLWFY